MKNISAILAGLLLGLAGSLLAADSPTPAGRDPIEGKWLGELDYSGDHCGIGLEIKRDQTGQLVAFYTKTALSVYAQPVGPLTVTDNVYTITAARLPLTLNGDRLECQMTPLKLPLVLHRVEQLPVAGAADVHAPGPAPRWQTMLGAPVYAAPAVRDGVAYVGTSGGIFNAIDLQDGSFRWVFAAGRPIHGEALVTVDAVFFVCDNGYLFKLARADGKELWRYGLGDAQVPRSLFHLRNYDNDHQAPQPALADGVLYVGSGDGSFHAVQADTGARVWRCVGDGSKIRLAALLDGPRVIFGNLGGKVLALDRGTGRELWRYDTGGPVTSAPVSSGGRIILGSRSSRLCALDPATGRELWKNYFWGSWVESTPVAAGDLFYVGSSDLHATRCYDSKDGHIVWSARMASWCWSRPAVSATTVYIGTGGTNFPQFKTRGGLTAIDRATGATKWYWVAPDLSGILLQGFVAAPALAGDLVLAAGLDGTLYAFPAE